VAQLTSSFNPLSTADPRARGSVRRASGFVQISIVRIEQEFVRHDQYQSQECAIYNPVQ
jgi:hypothetical protein